MGMALTSIANDGHGLPVEQAEVGVVNGVVAAVPETSTTARFGAAEAGPAPTVSSTKRSVKRVSLRRMPRL